MMRIILLITVVIVIIVIIINRVFEIWNMIMLSYETLRPTIMCTLCVIPALEN